MTKLMFDYIISDPTWYYKLIVPFPYVIIYNQLIMGTILDCRIGVFNELTKKKVITCTCHKTLSAPCRNGLPPKIVRSSISLCYPC